MMDRMFNLLLVQFIFISSLSAQLYNGKLTYTGTINDNPPYEYYIMVDSGLVMHYGPVKSYKKYEEEGFIVSVYTIWDTRNNIRYNCNYELVCYTMSKEYYTDSLTIATSSNIDIKKQYADSIHEVYIGQYQKKAPSNWSMRLINSIIDSSEESSQDIVPDGIYRNEMVTEHYREYLIELDNETIVYNPWGLRLREIPFPNRGIARYGECTMNLLKTRFDLEYKPLNETLIKRSFELIDVDQDYKVNIDSMIQRMTLIDDY